MKLNLKYLILILILILPSVHSFAEQEENEDPNVFLSFGQAEINHGNRAASRKKALAECLKDALRQFCAKNTSTNLFSNNDAILKKKLYDKYNLYLKDYRIKDETQDEKYYQLTALVKLNGDMIIEKLRELGFSKDSSQKPSILVLVSDIELKNNERNEFNWWSNEEQKSSFYNLHKRLARRLNLMGFKTLPESTFLQQLGNARISLKNKLIKGDIDSIRKHNFANIALLGSFSLEYVKTNTKDTDPYIATASLRIINLKDGIRLADLSKTYNIKSALSVARKNGESLTSEDAINNFIDIFCADIVESFLVKWTQSQIKTKLIELVISNIFEYKDYQLINEHLLKLKPLVDSVKDFSIKKGKLTYRLELNGLPKDLAQNIVRLKLSKGNLEIEDISTKQVRINVK